MAIESSSFWVGPPTEPVTYQPVKTLGTGGEGKRGVHLGFSQDRQ